MNLWFQSSVVITARILMMIIPAVTSFAMNMKQKGNQLFLSGPIEVGDEVEVQAALKENPSINTVILRNSPGGDVKTAYAIGNMIREKRLQTAVSGFCNSGCSRLFLGGIERLFTDDYSADLTHVGFHGHYYTEGPMKGQLKREAVEKAGLKQWIINHSDGKADPNLVERWINIPVNNGFMHFFHPGIADARKNSTFFCEHGPVPGAGIFGCVPIGKNALDLGIITSLNTIASVDQNELRASFPKMPSKTNFARIDDLEKLPISSEKVQDEYKRFLIAMPPKAFAISIEKSAFAWMAGNFEAINIALSRCAKRAGIDCKLYAVDNDVVW
jgi:hypothetical protein